MAARRQLVVLLVGLLVAGWAAHAVTQEQPVYWARVRAVLVADGALRNWLLQPGESAIPLAGLLERRMNAEVDAVPTNSPDITIIDRGITHGTVVFLPDRGGQWAHNFTEPIVVLEAAGPDETSVHEQMDGLIRRLRGELTTLQRDLLVPSSPRVGFSDSTLDYTVQAAAGRPKVAALGVLFVGGTLTLLACVCVERLRRSARNRDDATYPGAIMITAAPGGRV
ncbi:hypothetical protein [Janibacter melonis]|uniref:hypothetical protein n=1 Tax=Janibacter melonis TaxID=262209 RepID=UPI001E478A89|nr:hypothetical protein [Janibacter melonis]MCB5991427.1 hypothetical protein [Janibacter melonis]